MPRIKSDVLKDFTARIFRAYGLRHDVADIVADSLVLGNLKGHDSHGVIRVMEYVDWLAKGWLNADAEMKVVRDDGVILMIDGDFGFGQVIGRQATRLAIDKVRQEGVCVMTIRRSGHLGRVGEFMEMAGDAGLLAFGFTNTHGGGVLAAPYGGRERRLSANPILGAAPRADGDPIVMDMATCSTAEGKVKVARAAGKQIPEGYFVNSDGHPSTDPEDYYSDPPGALLPMAGHKGFALALMCDIFAGAVSGGECSTEGIARIANTLFAVFIDPERFCGRDYYFEQVEQLVRWVKSSELMEGFDRIMVPGEPEAIAEQARSAEGIHIEDSTWQKITSVAASKGIVYDFGAAT